MSGKHRSSGFRDGVHLERCRRRTTSAHGEHLKGTAKIEDLNVVEDDDGDVAHLGYGVGTGSANAAVSAVRKLGAAGSTSPT